MKALGMILLAGIVIYTLGHSGDELKQTQSMYCEMVGIYLASNGENGWPDYNGNFEEVCDE